jgi:putative transposase
MPFKRAPRLRGFSYIGPYRYFLTICVVDRRRVFSSNDRVHPLIAQIRRTAAAEHFAVLAYCFMPDHLHLLVEGLSARSDLRRFVKVLKQSTSFAWKQQYGEELWQRSYFDRVLRDDEDGVAVARYILANPIRAGFVVTPDAYPFSGSFELELGDLMDSLS